MSQTIVKQNLLLLIKKIYKKIENIYFCFLSSNFNSKEYLILRFNKFYFTSNLLRGFQSRNQSTLSMILDVFKFPDSVLVKEITVHTGDYPIKYNPEYFYYCIDEKSKLKNCIPDFTFKCWKEVGIESYDILRNQLLERSNVKPKIDKLFWAGNVKTHFSRVDFIEKFKEDKNKFEIYHVDPEVKNAKKFTILEHLDYKYLIDIQGRGYSSRLKFLLHSGRTLFIQERRWKSFYHFELIPFTHYIPIKEDFSDLYEKIKWAEMHPQESLDIAENAKKYAIENLSYESVLNVLKSKLFKN